MKPFADKYHIAIPCYIDQFYPQVGIATLELLQKLGLNVHYPLKQTCCGQPLANSGERKNRLVLINISLIILINSITWFHLRVVAFIMSESIDRVLILF